MALLGEWKRVGASKDQLSWSLMGYPVRTQDFAALVKCLAPTGPRGGIRAERRLLEDGSGTNYGRGLPKP